MNVHDRAIDDTKCSLTAIRDIYAAISAALKGFSSSYLSFTDWYAKLTCAGKMFSDDITAEMARLYANSGATKGGVKFYDSYFAFKVGFQYAGEWYAVYVGLVCRLNRHNYYVCQNFDGDPMVAIWYTYTGNVGVTKIVPVPSLENELVKTLETYIASL